MIVGNLDVNSHDCSNGDYRGFAFFCIHFTPIHINLLEFNVPAWTVLVVERFVFALGFTYVLLHSF